MKPATSKKPVTLLEQCLSAAYRRLAEPRELRRSRPVAAIRRPTKEDRTPLHALTAAALALPGLMLSPARAANGDQATFQYGLYEESQRFQLEDYKALHLEPLRVDNLSAGGTLTFLDRIKFAFNYTQDTWSGATPKLTAPAATMVLLASGASMAVEPVPVFNTRTRTFMAVTPDGSLAADTRKVHMMTMASPETRKQGDFRLGYEWDEAALNVTGGVSKEDDYDSHHFGADGRLDLNDKRTTLNLGASATNSKIRALRDAQYGLYIDYSTVFDQDYLTRVDEYGNPKPLTGERDDWSAQISLSQVLTQNTVVKAGASYTNSSGFLENPYKVAELFFADPAAIDPVTGLVNTTSQGVLERRPNRRHQWTFDVGAVQYVPLLDASLHFDYRFFHDDWGINAHTFEAAWGQPVGGGWTVTPRVRYYSQDAASFYSPYFVLDQAVTFTPDFAIDVTNLPMDNFSSDHRLSGYGALSGGVTFSKQFAKGVNLDAGFEYYSHQGSLKLGSGGEDGFADFSYYQISAALRVDLDALGNLGGPSGDHDGHFGHVSHSPAVPAGVMFDHVLHQSGEWMVGYRYMFLPQDGDTLHGTESVGDAKILANACGGTPCSLKMDEHMMHMHMVEIMYAPTDWLTLMAMPQFLDMTMDLRRVENGPSLAGGDGHSHGNPNANSVSHATGGIGDTGLYALFNLFEVPGHRVNAALGLSAPTGDVRQKIDGEDLIHYAMQLGSGTWDLRPSLTYTGDADRWSWGAQVSGIKRLQDVNERGYALGDMYQTTAWGSYNLSDWLSASVRGLYTSQGKIRGEFNEPNDQNATVDFPANYGGQYWDVGFGLNATVTGGDFQGNRFSIEWLQPVQDDVKGYQLEREGSLAATWGLAF